MDVSTYLFSAGTSVFVVAIGKLWDNLWSKRSEDKNLHFLVIKLIFLFDRYVDGCVQELVDVDEHNYNSGAYDQEEIAEVPVFPELPVGDDYKLIEHKLLVQILAFSLKRTEACNKLSTLWDYNDHDEMVEIAEREILKLGIAANELSEKLRERYKLPNKQDTYDEIFDSVDFLKDRQGQIFEKDAKRRKAEAESDP